ncbi:hypothetical protein ABOM_006187 [Aspergillus bombycis]|uniref:Uncharacterized protein n=1 Tax=Aspergillus bombycis TaxID=109264 RepID=A0A1F7ZZA9_9EURO|nr:hypothetical protein ABOM_006187 [Aspergillus bombycis]OGM44802.1 hypothetical protein ABOM_006187 [Aspergillus bombycis]
MTAIRDDNAKDGTRFAAINTPASTFATAKYRSACPALQLEDHTATATATPTTSTSTSTPFTASARPAATFSTATFPAATGATHAQAGYGYCPGPKLHPSCYSSGPYVIPATSSCQKAPGFPGRCVCYSEDVPDPVTPEPYHREVFELKKSMGVSAGIIGPISPLPFVYGSRKLMYQVPYLVEEDCKFWFHAPNGDYMHLTVKQIAEKQCAGHWANTCTGQPYYQCEPKDRIRYDAQDFNAVFQKSGLSHIEFHKRYQPF